MATELLVSFLKSGERGHNEEEDDQINRDGDGDGDGDWDTFSMQLMDGNFCAALPQHLNAMVLYEVSLLRLQAT